jgi:lipoprotein-anchoring transpeptidase ErfK/SrfK
MLAGKDVRLTPEYEPLPYETEEIGPDFGKWVETDLTRQITYLWDGNKKLKTYVVSTGKNVTPTITGTYRIYMKRDHHDMKGYDPIKEKDYVQPDVRYISYFEGAYAYHAAYWHNAFGTQVSHGCINMKTPEAKYLYEWAPVGTTCIIHY